MEAVVRARTDPGRVRILVVEDEPDVAELLGRVIESCGAYDVRLCLDPGEFESALDPVPDLVFTDLMMPGLDGFEVIRRLKSIEPDLPVVVVSAYATIENAVKAVKLGAFDFLAKPFTPETVELILAKLERDRGLRARAAELSRQARERDPELRALLGDSPAIQKLRAWIWRVRETNAPVLIEGETGTGKELVARALHAGRGPYVAINMAAIPDELAEAELFGVRRGAFTGAIQDRPGLFAEAGEGTLFLDEINAMTPALQAKLLRVFQERQVRPVGGGAPVPLRCRIVSASNADLATLTETGRFRRDLYHRLNVLQVRLPPLRERPEDIPLLAEHFLHRYTRAHGRRLRRIAPEAMAALVTSTWPGNVRELENVIEQAVILAPDDAAEITLRELPAELGGEAGLSAGPGDQGPGRTLAEVEAHYIRTVLAYTRGNKAAAARILGIDYKTLLRKLARGAD